LGCSSVTALSERVGAACPTVRHTQRAANIQPPDPPCCHFSMGCLAFPACGLSNLPANSADLIFILFKRPVCPPLTWYQDKYWDNYDRCFWTGGQSHVATKAVGPQGSRSKIEASCAACSSHLGHIFPGGRRTTTYGRAPGAGPPRPRPPRSPGLLAVAVRLDRWLLRDQLLPLSATPSHRGWVATLTGVPHQPQPQPPNPWCLSFSSPPHIRATPVLALHVALWGTLRAFCGVGFLLWASCWLQR